MIKRARKRRRGEEVKRGSFSFSPFPLFQCAEDHALSKLGPGYKESPNNILPLPRWEGIEGRVIFLTPSSYPPPSRGRKGEDVQ